MAEPSVLEFRPGWGIAGQQVPKPRGRKTQCAIAGAFCQLCHRCSPGMPVFGIVHGVQQYGHGVHRAAVRVLRHPRRLSASQGTGQYPSRPVLDGTGRIVGEYRVVDLDMFYAGHVFVPERDACCCWE